MRHELIRLAREAISLVDVGSLAVVAEEACATAERLVQCPHCAGAARAARLAARASFDARWGCGDAQLDDVLTICGLAATVHSRRGGSWPPADYQIKEARELVAGLRGALR